MVNLSWKDGDSFLAWLTFYCASSCMALFSCFASAVLTSLTSESAGLAHTSCDDGHGNCPAFDVTPLIFTYPSTGVVFYALPVSVLRDSKVFPEKECEATPSPTHLTSAVLLLSSLLLARLHDPGAWRWTVLELDGKSVKTWIQWAIIPRSSQLISVLGQDEPSWEQGRGGRQEAPRAGSIPGDPEITRASCYVLSLVLGCAEILRWG